MKMHWANIDTGTPACGEPSRAAKITHDQGAVTCGRCKRWLGIKPLVAKGFLAKYSPRAMDSLLGRAFKDAEGEMAVALVEAEKVLDNSLKAHARDFETTIAELSGALRRLVDLLGSKTSN